ncbi:beta-N-acetylhexosaminidase [Amorphus suaedae]
MNETRAFITGIAGPVLTVDEVTFLREAAPWGVILFQRNCVDEDQVHGLVEDLRDALGWRVPVLIDQEGGRVQRLKPPIWPAYPPVRVYGDLYLADRSAGVEACGLATRLIASDLHALGIDVDCLPLVDVPVTGSHDIIGDRAYATRPDVVSRLGGVAIDAMLAGGVLPVIKHIPGHGRARSDSHLALPVVEASWDELVSSDFVPFGALNDCPLAMTAHVVYTAIDPVRPATTSPDVIERVIRHAIGYDGCLMSDDLSMRALSGGLGDRAVAAMAAGCDLALHCNGHLDEMEAVAEAVPVLAGAALERADRALAARRAPAEFDVAAARARLAELLEPVWAHPGG